MGIFRCQVFKTLGIERPWTNVYHIEAATLVIASNAAVDIILEQERALLSTTVTISKILTSDPETHEFVIVNSTADGLLSLSALLPLWNTLKVNFPVNALGRPDFKFYRGCADESNTEDFEWVPANATAFGAVLSDMIDSMSTNSTPLVDDEGHIWTGAVVQNAIQMRQRHRRRRRVVAP